MRDPGLAAHRFALHPSRDDTALRFVSLPLPHLRDLGAVGGEHARAVGDRLGRFVDHGLGALLPLGASSSGASDAMVWLAARVMAMPWSSWPWIAFARTRPLVAPGANFLRILRDVDRKVPLCRKRVRLD